MSARRLYPPISALRSAEAAARLGGFTAAAEELHVSQSAVSQAVKQLEEQLGIPLFERRPGGLVPTHKGQAYIDEIRPALELIAAAGGKLFAPGRQRLTIGCIRSLLHNWLLSRLPLYGALRPDLDLNVVGIGRDLAEGRMCDLAIVLEDLDHPPADGILIARETLIPVGAPSTVRTLTRPLERYGSEIPVALLGTGWDSWIRATGREGNIIHTGLQFRDASAALEAARAGQGIVLAGSLICRDDVSTQLLVPVSDIRVERGRGYWLLGKEAGSAVGDEFRSWMLTLIGEAGDNSGRRD